MDSEPGSNRRLSQKSSIGPRRRRDHCTGGRPAQNGKKRWRPQKPGAPARQSPRKISSPSRRSIASPISPGSWVSDLQPRSVADLPRRSSADPWECRENRKSFDPGGVAGQDLPLESEPRTLSRRQFCQSEPTRITPEIFGSPGTDKIPKTDQLLAE